MTPSALQKAETHRPNAVLEIFLLGLKQRKTDCDEEQLLLFRTTLQGVPHQKHSEGGKQKSQSSHRRMTW